MLLYAFSFISFCLLFLGIRHCDEEDTTARRSSGWIGVRGCRTAYYSSDSTTPPTSPLFSLYFFTFLLPSRWTSLIEDYGPFLAYRSLPRGSPLAPRSPAGESLLQDQEDLLLLQWVLRSSFSYHSQCSGRYGRCPSQGGTQVFGVMGRFSIFFWAGLTNTNLSIQTLVGRDNIPFIVYKWLK